MTDIQGQEARALIVLTCRSMRATLHGQPNHRAQVCAAVFDADHGVIESALYGLAGMFNGILDSACEASGQNPDSLFETSMRRLLDGSS